MSSLRATGTPRPHAIVILVLQLRHCTRDIFFKQPFEAQGLTDLYVPRQAHAMRDALECEVIPIIVRCTGHRVSKDERQTEWAPTHLLDELLEALNNCCN